MADQFFKKAITKVSSIKKANEQPPEIVQLLVKLGKAKPQEALENLGSTALGLSAVQAGERLEKYGKNEIAQEKPPVWWIQLIKAFITPFNIILIVLGATSYLTDVVWAGSEKDWTKIIVLSLMISVSGLLRFWQEFRSQKAAEKLKKLIHNNALVLRQHWENEGGTSGEKSKNGSKREINIANLVPGDIVYLSAGDMIPADMRLINSIDLFITQSSLTGESMPIEKFAIPVTREEKEEWKHDAEIKNPLELNTLVFMGTSVISGSGTGVVIATGKKTYFGSIAQKITGERDLTSFDKGINKVSWVLIYFMLVMVPVVFIINAITKNSLLEALLFALAVAVGLTPEMLPLVVTANLAKGATEMVKKKVIVKKLNAIQNFGAMDVLCTDKTGTITENRVVLVRHIDPAGKESRRVLDMAYLNSHLQTGLKNLMDTAIIEHREKAGHFEEEQSYHKIDEIPFDFSRRRMSVIVQKEDGAHLLVCKGAVEEVEPLCTHIELAGNRVEATKEVLEKTKEMVNQINQNGLRVLAVAYKEVSEKKKIYKPQDENNLTLVGFVGFLDPPKESAKTAIALLEQHGVQVKIITGDNSIVTAKVAEDVGLASNKILRGDQIEALNDEELKKEAEQTNIFTKIDPLQKARIVKALKDNGHAVGFLGDGVNDAAALKTADVGISVDNAVDIAKETADIILLENDLLVLEQGVIEGRTIFGNIMKYIKMTASSNFGNVFSVLIASAFLPFLPMMPIQLLIQNLLYDFSQLSIPWDNMDKEFLQKPRKWESSDIPRFMIFIGPLSSVFDIATYLVLWFVFSANVPATQSLFQSGWFVEGLLSQTLIVHLIRTQKVPFLESRAAKPVLLLTLVIIFIGISIPFSHFGRTIGLQALPLGYFPWLAAILLCYFILVHLVKTWYIKKYNEWL